MQWHSNTPSWKTNELNSPNNRTSYLVCIYPCWVWCSIQAKVGLYSYVILWTHGKRRQGTHSWNFAILKISPQHESPTSSVKRAVIETEIRPKIMHAGVAANTPKASRPTKSPFWQRVISSEVHKLHFICAKRDILTRMKFYPSRHLFPWLHRARILSSLLREAFVYALVKMGARFIVLRPAFCVWPRVELESQVVAMESLLTRLVNG